MLAVLGLVTGNIVPIALAGLCALASGLYTLDLGGRLRRARTHAEESQAQAEQAKAQSDLMSARAAKFEAEALVARSRFEEAPAAPAAPGGSESADVIDEGSGLFTEMFFTATLDQRVSAARRGLRPLSLALLDPSTNLRGKRTEHTDFPRVAAGVRSTVRDADIACRLTDGTIALILEDTPENGAVWTVERIRRTVTAEQEDITLRAGIACYPAHAFDAEQLVAQARDALRAAKDWHQDRIEVAAIPED